MNFLVLNQELYREETLSAFVVVALILLVGDGILYYAIPLNPGVQQWVLLLLHQSLQARHVILLVLVLPLLPLLQVVRVYQSHYELLTCILLDLFFRVHDHFLMINLCEKLYPAVIRQAQSSLYL
jgi:hypothetical protein